MAGRGRSSAAARRGAVIYCVVPRALAPRVHGQLRRHFRDDPRIQVVVERREADRRRPELRRRVEADVADERRRIRNAEGRRIADRRALAVPAEVPALPMRLRRYAEQLTFIERCEPQDEHREDLDTARLVTRIQGGDREGFSELYMRYFDRVYAYMKVALEDPHDAEDLTQQVFVRVMQALPAYERRQQPFRAWLFTIVRNQAISHLRKRGELALDPTDVARELEDRHSLVEALPVLEWITDRELLLFIERLPPAQRQVLMLRYMLDLSTRETAVILGRSYTSVRTLQHRALGFLRDRLAAVGRDPRHGERAQWRRRVTQAPVLRSRRFVLAGH